MKAADTSLVVAAFASWHQQHEPARALLDKGLHLIEHCALETYSVLTRLPPPHRCSGEVVRDFIRARFAPPLLCLDADAYREFVLELPTHGITGGAAYDALIAATAAACRMELVSCDQRAVGIYEAYGVRATLLK